MESSEDVIMLAGPPFCGKSLFYRQHLRKIYARVCPSEIFKMNPDYGLRDVCLQIFNSLKKGKQIVIDDENEQYITRQAYFTAIGKKSNIKLLKMVPKFGELQCQWGQQFAMATVSEQEAQPMNMVNEKQVPQWFLSNRSDAQLPEHKDVSVKTETLPLKVVTNYKLEVPVLFLQWEGINTDSKNTSLVAELCNKWYASNPCGRIIVICDGLNLSKGLINQQEDDFAVKTFLKAMVEEMKIPVYVLQMVHLSKAGTFCVPPEPGILAFLQRRHYLDLHCKATQYVYTSSSHKSMAEKAGVRYIKISQVLHHPNLLVSGHSSASPQIPDLMKHMVVEADLDSDCIPAEIPLYHHTENMKDGCVRVDLPGGRREALYARSLQDVHSYQNDYTTNATPAGGKNSRIQNLRIGTRNETPNSNTTDSLFQLPDVQTLTSDSSTGSTATLSRGLPSWMLGKSKQTSVSSVSKNDSNSSNDGQLHRSRSTVYIMTEKELIETAQQILRQNDREDILENLEKEAKKTKTEEKEQTLSNGTDTHKTHKQATRLETEMFDLLAGSTLSSDSSPRKRAAPQHVLASPAKRLSHKTLKEHLPASPENMLEEQQPTGSDLDIAVQASEAEVNCQGQIGDMVGDSQADASSRQHDISAMLDSIFG